MIGRDEVDAWKRDGMLILPGFFSEPELLRVETAMRSVWERRDPRVVVDDLETNRRCLLSDLSQEERKHRFKTNDLYLTEVAIRELGMGRRIARILRKLLDAPPVLCNSLNFDQGSAQEAHIDSLYMTPCTPGHLCAIWVALEDVRPEAGPLFYYRGSHKIPPRRFSDGSFHAIPAEMEHWKEQTEQGIAALHLRKEIFLAKRGDVFVWSADLLHGGAPLEDKEATRKSVVFHYFTESDARKMGARLVPINGGYWMNRARQRVLEDGPSGLGLELRALDARLAELEQDVAQYKQDPTGLIRLVGRIAEFGKTRLRMSESPGGTHEVR